MKHAVVCAYRLPHDGKIEEAPQVAGPALWAVRRLSFCLNKDGQWEYEPMPSSRDDEFLARCRWPTVEAAYGAWLAAHPAYQD